jgi:hypothetical protein
MMVKFWNLFTLLLALLPHLSAALTSLKDGAALDSFLGKQDVAMIEFFDEKEGRSIPEDLQEASKLLELGDVTATARIAGTEEVLKKFDFQASALPIVHLFIKSKPYGDDFDGERKSETAASEIAAFARQKTAEARDEGVLKEKGEVEELKSSRADRLCFKAEGVCAIFLANGQASGEEISMLTKLKKKNMSKLSTGANARGTTFNWSWIDANAEPAFKALLNGDPPELPGMVIYNPHKRPRYFALEEGTAATEESVQNLLDKLLGGDARFTPAKGQKLPTFAGKAEL